MSQVSAPDQREAARQSDTRLAGILLCLAGILFFIFNHVAEAIYPNFSVSNNSLSDLGAAGQPTALLWNPLLFITSVLWILGAYFFLGKSRRSKLILALYILPPVGQVVVSLFPENTILAIHAVGALVTFILGGIGALFAYRLTSIPFRYFSLLLGAISLASLAFYASGSYLGLGVGGVERMILYPLIVWVIMLGAYLMANDYVRQVPM